MVFCFGLTLFLCSADRCVELTLLSVELTDFGEKDFAEKEWPFCVELGPAHRGLIKSGFLLEQVFVPLSLKGHCLFFRLYLKIMTQVKVPRLFLDWFRFFVIMR